MGIANLDVNLRQSNFTSCHLLVGIKALVKVENKAVGAPGGGWGP